MVFKALQTYSNKEVVRWIEEPAEGGEEPESPAPVLALSAPAADAHGAPADDKSGEAAKEKTTASSDDTSSSNSDSTARVLGIVGIVVGVAGVAFGVLAGRRRNA